MNQAIRVSVLLLLPAAAAFAQSGRIQGVVTDDAGRTVPGAYAVAIAQSATDHSTYAVVTGTRGEYSFDSLRAGKYQICIQSPAGAVLSSCQWSAGTTISVSPGQALTNQGISVTSGSLLQLHINDTRKLVAATDDLLVGVYLPSGMFQPMRLAASGDGNRTYSVAVPKKGSVRVAIVSSRLQIADEKGAVLNSPAIPGGLATASAATNAVITLPAPSADSVTLALSVTGRR
ncbi:MAG: carboxypeptidase-like regulatory domain-containing protein [Candidatus Solibacter sp.]